MEYDIIWWKVNLATQAFSGPLPDTQLISPAWLFIQITSPSFTLSVISRSCPLLSHSPNFTHSLCNAFFYFWWGGTSLSLSSIFILSGYNALTSFLMHGKCHCGNVFCFFTPFPWDEITIVLIYTSPGKTPEKLQYNMESCVYVCVHKSF